MARILVVDDDPLFLRIITFMLHRNHHSVVTTDSVKDALAILADQPIDIVFVDINIPGMSGISLLDQLRADDRYANLPVVILTASAWRRDRSRALRRGATAFLHKPASSWELNETVSRLSPAALSAAQI